MLLVTVCVLFFSITLAQCLINPGHPILDPYTDKNVPFELLEQRGDLDNVGLVIHKDSIKNLNKKSSTVGNNFANGYYTRENQLNHPLKLCPPYEQERAVFIAGTGFTVSKQQFATAHHVVELILREQHENVKDPLNFVKEIAIVFHFGRKNQVIYQANKIDISDADNDLIIISTTQSFTHSKKGRLVSAKQDPKPGDEVYMMGHPLGMTLRYTTGTVNRVEKITGKKPRIHIVTSGFTGNSGSPIMNKNGEVVGIFSSYDDSSKEVDYEWNVVKKCYAFKTVDPTQPAETAKAVPPYRALYTSSLRNKN